MTALAPRPGILDIAPYIGGESAIPGVTRVIKLSSNEGALGPSPKAMEAYRALAPEIHRYPDGSCSELRAALGSHWGLDPARIVCGAGSDELLGLLTRAYAGPGDEVLYSRHGFLMYAIAARTAGATPVTAPETNLTADVDALLKAVTPRTRIVFLANPNNPTGSYLPADEVARLRKGLRPDILLVIDAAYAEYVTRNDYGPGNDLVDASVGGAENVVVARTFSKIYALGALRLGWAYCPPSIADVLNRARNPFNVSAAAQAAGIAALSDIGFTDEVRAVTIASREWAAERMAGLGLVVHPSVGNFLLVEFPRAKGRDADEANDFLTKRGIIGRKMGAYGLGHCLRITVGRKDEMAEVVDALNDFLKG